MKRVRIIPLYSNFFISHYSRSHRAKICFLLVLQAIHFNSLVAYSLHTRCSLNANCMISSSGNMNMMNKACFMYYPLYLKICLSNLLDSPFHILVPVQVPSSATITQGKIIIVSYPNYHFPFSQLPGQQDAC